MSSSTNVNISLGESNLRRCAACKYLRRRCAEDCILSPYFPASLPHRFAYVHRIFGASNVARMLQFLPDHERAQAADAIALEAYWRSQDPVYGSVGIISQLQHEILRTQREIARTQAQIAIYAAPQQQLQLTEPGAFHLQAAAAAGDVQMTEGAGARQQQGHRPPASADEVPRNLRESQEQEEAVQATTGSPASFGFGHFSDYFY